MKFIPQYVLDIAEKLEEAGFEAFLVGGSVRNLLLGRPVKDYDITTNAIPEQIAAVFPESITTNARFGTVVVIGKDEFGESKTVEITTYRSEKEYVGGRWPSHVEFSTHISDDLKRRDFTINAMAVRLSDEFRVLEFLTLDEFVQFLTSGDLIVDLYGGMPDLRGRVIRAVGEPIERFREDGLRAMRACRFASVLDFTIEENTFDAISRTLEVSALISMERVRDEFVKMLMDSHKPSVGIELMRKTGLLTLYIPELLEGYGMEQNQYHVHDVYQHLLDTVDIAPDEIKIAALFHDIGKARTKEGAHFYGHDQVGSEMTREILTRLKFPKKEIEDTVLLVRWHMFYMPSSPIEHDHEHAHDDNKEKRKEHFVNGWSDAAIRRMIRRVGGQENVDKLIQLRIADATANPRSSFDPDEIRVLAERVAAIREIDSLLSVKDLQITGNDLKGLGIPEGPMMRTVLSYLLEKVIDDIELNTLETLSSLAIEYYERNRS
jgi:poly(A) polymerase/tRNA nucleotidyltransferase (CCA-adding enzyme)